jgi:hypothetical protein
MWLARRERLVRTHDFASQREQGDRNELEVGDAERNADDRDAQDDARDDVGQDEPPAREDQPQDVADAERRARVVALHRRTAERPQGVDADTKSGDAERDCPATFPIAPQECCGSA